MFPWVFWSVTSDVFWHDGGWTSTAPASHFAGRPAPPSTGRVSPRWSVPKSTLSATFEDGQPKPLGKKSMALLAGWGGAIVVSLPYRPGARSWGSTPVTSLKVMLVLVSMHESATSITFFPLDGSYWVVLSTTEQS